MIHLDYRHLKQVQLILKHNLPKHEIWAFGSRVHGKNLKPFSDLDLVIFKPSATIQQIIHLIDVFSESNLAFKVDIIDWHSIDENFKNIIKQQYEVIQK